VAASGGPLSIYFSSERSTFLPVAASVAARISLELPLLSPEYPLIELQITFLWMIAMTQLSDPTIFEMILTLGESPKFVPLGPMDREDARLARNVTQRVEVQLPHINRQGGALVIAVRGRDPIWKQSSGEYRRGLLARLEVSPHR
jgi:hypothetical protein